MGQFGFAPSALRMKMLVVLALVACVAAEPEADAKADPYYSYGLGYRGYSGLGYSGLGYSSLGYSGLGYSGLGYARLGYSGLGYSRGFYGKRSADADAEAKADPYYSYGLGYRVYSGLGYSGLGYSNLGYSGLGYSGLGYSGLGYSGLGYSRGFYGKRSADADAEAKADPYYSYGLGYSGLGYR